MTFLLAGQRAAESDFNCVKMYRWIQLFFFSLFLVQFEVDICIAGISTCCDEVNVVGVGDAFQAYPDIFNTTYKIEPNLLNGRVHYTSLDRRFILAFSASRRQWYIQTTGKR